ncbi:hypothetical protein [Roseovarius salis]|uniref:hypothetical protein n=1 Tax=Roseovarius salis TaxID=3376063 RepID=UPI0037CC6697
MPGHESNPGPGGRVLMLAGAGASVSSMAAAAGLARAVAGGAVCGVGAWQLFRR